MVASIRKTLNCKYLLTTLTLFLTLFFTHAAIPVFSQETPDTPKFDLDGNLVIDAKDLFLLINQWKSSDSASDFNNDGKIDALDLLLFIQSFHSTIEPVPTPTPTLTPTSTPTPVVDTPTPTPTPEEDTPTPTETPTPGDVTPTPTPIPAGLLFFTNFDTAETLADAGMVTLTEDNAEQLENENRKPFDNSVIPWFILNTETLDRDFGEKGVALSDPKSAALNENLLFYNSRQTSVLEIQNPLDTSQAVEPVLSFDVAYNLEFLDEFSLDIGDYMVIEVKGANSESWSILDLNGDGVVTTDIQAFDPNNPQALLAGTFDGLFGASNPDNKEGPLTQDDFIPVEVSLPQDTALQIAFRFESNSSIFGEGVFLDNIRVLDAAAGGVGPTIRRVTNRDGGDIFVDTETRILIQGNRFDNIQKVLFNSRDGQNTELSFTVTQDGIQATLPRLSEPTQEESATIEVLDSEGTSSGAFSVKMKAAPSPEIDTISPSPFFLDAGNSTIRIFGKNFRPAFSGATESGGTSVSIDTGLGDPIKFEFPNDFLKRTENEIAIDGSALKSLSPGPVSIQVKNEYSGLESNTADLTLQSGSGGLDVTGFTIEVGSQSFDPATDSFQLQQDQSVTLVWDISGTFSSNQLNIDLSGTSYVVNGELNNTVIANRLEELGQADKNPGDKVALTANFFSVALQISPMIISTSGTVTASIQIGNGDPVNKTFVVLDPQPPILYERSDDWSSQTWSISEDIDSFINPFKVVGDNFRGISNQGTDSETFSQVFLLPVEGGDPIPLPILTSIFDVQITPLIGDDSTTEDILFQSITTDFWPTVGLTIPEGETREFKIRVLNPDSGLSVDSTKTVIFGP